MLEAMANTTRWPNKSRHCGTECSLGMMSSWTDMSPFLPPMDDDKDGALNV